MPKANNGRGSDESITTVRLSAQEREAIAARAKETQVTPSEVIRWALRYSGVTTGVQVR